MARRRRSFGLIRKRGKQYYARWTERGREKEVRVGPTWDLADRFLARKAVELGMERASGVRPVAPVKFKDLLERYEAIFAGEKRSTTLAREGAYLRSKALPHFEGQRVDEVRREDIERFLIQRAESDKVGAATRNRMLNILSAFFWKAVALNHARENPCKDVPRKKEELRDCPFLAPEDQEKLIACTPEAMRPVVEEYESYSWDESSAERGHDRPLKRSDHAMDMIRYFLYTVLRPTIDSSPSTRPGTRSHSNVY